MNKDDARYWRGRARDLDVIERALDEGISVDRVYAAESASTFASAERNFSLTS